MTRTIGIILLCVYLVLVGLLAISNFQFDFSRFVVGALAIAAAVFLAWGK